MIICIIKTAITINNLHNNNITIVTNNNIHVTIYMNKMQAFDALLQALKNDNHSFLLHKQ